MTTSLHRPVYMRVLAGDSHQTGSWELVRQGHTGKSTRAHHHTAGLHHAYSAICTPIRMYCTPLYHTYVRWAQISCSDAKRALRETSSSFSRSWLRARANGDLERHCQSYKSSISKHSKVIIFTILPYQHCTHTNIRTNKSNSTSPNFSLPACLSSTVAAASLPSPPLPVLVSRDYSLA